MKWFVAALCGVLLSVLMICSPFFATKQTQTEYLRLHIRANSNTQEDQRVKYKVKDAIVEALIPLLADVETKDQAKDIVVKNFDYINAVADEVLKSEGFYYGAKSKIATEEFPTRTYENITLEQGEYEAVIIELGTGTGDNWWCLVYPAFCFTKTKNPTNYVYISKIWEIIEKVSGRNKN